MSRTLLAFAFAVAGALTACGDTPADDPHDPPDPVLVDSVDVTGPAFDLTPGETVQLGAVARDAAGNELTGRSFAWRSDDDAVATVSPSGLVTAVGAGEVVISASTGGATGGLFLTVAPEARPVAYVELTPTGEVELEAGATLQLTATAFDSDGNALAGRAFTWQTEDSAVATISDGGLLTAVAPGESGVRVICESQRADLTVRVPDVVDPPVPVDHITLDYTEVTLLVGRTHQLQATPRDADGNALARPVTWSSNNPAYASVDAGGLVTAIEVGGADITATSEGQTASMRVWVTQNVGYSLISVGGHNLPAHLGTYTTEIAGDTVTATVRIYDGLLSVDHISGVYQLEMRALVTTAVSAVPLPRTYESFGSVSHDAETGVFTFQPQIGDPFTGTWTPNGVLAIQMQPEPRLTGLATFLFRE